MPHVSVRGIRFHYTEHGSGPVVLIFPDAARSAAEWARVAEAVAGAGFTVRAVDPRGHGASTRFDDAAPADAAANPWSAVATDTFVKDARALLPALAPDGAHVVGHGFGGAVATWLAYWEGVERVRSLVVAAAPPQASAAYRAWFAKHGLPGEAVQDATDAYAHTLAERMRALLADVDDDEYASELVTQYKGRALVAEGADDPTYNPAQTMLWYGWLRNGRVLRAPGGHDFPIDGADGEAWFLEHLLRHLKEATA